MINSFEETLLSLEHSRCRAIDIFSGACVEAFANFDMNAFGYAFTQLFEPDVLRELALLEEVPYEELSSLRHRPSQALVRLGAMVDDCADANVVEVINIASALVSISRFSLADDILANRRAQCIDPRTGFELGWLDFLISNRLDDGARSPVAFQHMREAMDSGAVPPERMLDACTQAVVWHLKRKEVSHDQFAWAMSFGERLVRDQRGLDRAAVSSWFRGIAMEPAARRDHETTRQHMQRARAAAEEAVAERPSAATKNLLKTYYESSIKEHMFVNRDRDAAVDAGQALIALDPVWSPSYGELAEAQEVFGDTAAAAENYERAVAAGPPYFGHHLMRAARTRLALGDIDRALEHYTTLRTIAPHSEVVTRAIAAAIDRASPAARDKHAAVAAESSRRQR